MTVEPFGDYVNRLSFDVTSIDPALVTAAGPTTLTITGTMTNAGPEALTDLSYRFQRGESLGSDADVRQELLAAQRTDRTGSAHLHPDFGRPGGRCVGAVRVQRRASPTRTAWMSTPPASTR